MHTVQLMCGTVGSGGQSAKGKKVKFSRRGSAGSWARIGRTRRAGQEGQDVLIVAIWTLQAYRHTPSGAPMADHSHMGWA